MRNRFLVVLVVAGVLAPSGVALATDGSSGGAEAPSANHKAEANNHKRVKLPKILKKIAQCESGGDPRAVSPDGKYRGKYQFSRPTWRSVGGHGDPAKASEYEQDKRALKLYKREGTKPWPNCA
jgi:hypothetical protein